MFPGCFERVLQFSKDTFRDGGLHGWIAVLCLFTTKMAANLLVNCLGMMLPTLQEQFMTSTWLIGWMVAIVDAASQFSGILATPLKERFGARTVVTMSGLVAGISMITASFLSSLYAIIFTLAGFTGPAIGISFVLTNHLIGCYFTESITTAYAMASLGNSFVFMAAVPVLELLLDIYGWRGTMLLLGASLLHLAVIGALIQPPAARGGKYVYKAALLDKEQETRDDDVVPSNCCGCSCFTKVNSFTRDTFQLGLFSSLSFWLVISSVSMWTMTYNAWLIYYVQYSTEYKEFTMEDASRFLVAYGLGRTVSCLVIGPCIQTVNDVSTYTWVAMASLLLAIYFAVDPWLTSFWLITVNAFVFGNALSIAAILVNVVVKETFGIGQMGHVLGWMGMATGLTLLLFLHFPGLIYDLTGDYTVAFSLMAGLESLTVVAVLWLSWKQKRPHIY
ncbi:monocarboxylate transporter 12-like [Asterias amurensis]|uniref:monocarboxylate transporter 12-like n=1 Tax=Asterias amurensis TaxID=7602 RepID=UPI003AB50B0C